MPERSEDTLQRLDKILSEAKVASRSQLRQLIRAGQVAVDGVVVREPEQKIAEDACITVRGEAVEKLRPVLLVLNKPAGYITATEDRYQKTVMELVPERYRRLGVVPVGRLDKDTEGLLLFTNDGELAHRLISPRWAVEKVYYAEHEGEAGEADIAAFAKGLTLADGTHCLPAKLEPLGPGRCRVTVQEGKYHQVRRMLAARGLPVCYLKRLSEGPVELGELPLGEMTEICLDIFHFGTE